MDLLIEEENACACGHHFTKDDFVKKSVLESFEHKPQFNNKAVPTVFSFCAPAKYRKFNKVRVSKAEHCAIVEEVKHGENYSPAMLNKLV